MVYVEVAEHYGLCGGAAVSIRDAKKVGESYPGKVRVLGNVLNNAQIIADLTAAGVPAIEVGSSKLDKYDPMAIWYAVDQVQEGEHICVTAHGIEKEVIEALWQRVGPAGGVHNLACKRGVIPAQQKAKEYHQEGYGVILVASLKDTYHPEVRGLLSHAGTLPEHKFLVTEISDLASVEFRDWMKEQKGVGIIAKTTAKEDHFNGVVKYAVQIGEEYGIDIRYTNTICGATARRQKAMSDLAPKVGSMVVVGDPSSSNTNKLMEIVKKTNPSAPAFLVLDYGHLERMGAIPEIIAAGSVGVHAGASAFPSSVEGVIQGLRDL